DDLHAAPATQRRAVLRGAELRAGGGVRRAVADGAPIGLGAVAGDGLRAGRRAIDLVPVERELGACSADTRRVHRLQADRGGTAAQSLSAAGADAAASSPDSAARTGDGSAADTGPAARWQPAAAPCATSRVAAARTAPAPCRAARRPGGNNGASGPA